jgi:hypothetical protein
MISEELENGIVRAIDNALDLKGLRCHLTDDGLEKANNKNIIKLDSEDVYDVSKTSTEFFNTDMVLYTLAQMLKEGEATISINEESKNGKYLLKLLKEAKDDSEKS